MTFRNPQLTYVCRRGLEHFIPALVRSRQEGAGGDRAPELLLRQDVEPGMLVRELGDHVAGPAPHRLRPPMEPPVHVGQGARAVAADFVADKARNLGRLQDLAEADERADVCLAHVDVVLGVHEQIVAIHVVGEELLVRERQRVRILRGRPGNDLHPEIDALRGFGGHHDVDVQGHGSISLDDALQAVEVLLPEAGDGHQHLQPVRIVSNLHPILPSGRARCRALAALSDGLTYGRRQDRRPFGRSGRRGRGRFPRRRRRRPHPGGFRGTWRPDSARRRLPASWL